MRSALRYPHRFWCAPTRSSNKPRLCRFMCRFSDAGKDELTNTARRPASEKRQGTKSREWGTRPCRERLWGFDDEPSHEEPGLRSLACSAFIERCVFAWVLGIKGTLSVV